MTGIDGAKIQNSWDLGFAPTEFLMLEIDYIGPGGIISCGHFSFMHAARPAESPLGRQRSCPSLRDAFVPRLLAARQEASS